MIWWVPIACRRSYSSVDKGRWEQQNCCFQQIQTKRKSQESLHYCHWFQTAAVVAVVDRRRDIEYFYSCYNPNAVRRFEIRLFLLTNNNSSIWRLYALFSPLLSLSFVLRSKFYEEVALVLNSRSSVLIESKMVWIWYLVLVVLLVQSLMFDFHIFFWCFGVGNSWRWNLKQWF